ncbi:MAG: aspartate racemase [Firmicutes bacterium HGW-Firmicutes-12]|nr:MAG: aspartate racemase [Firmicutes bacterium HGW-Firmicutes-12]
MKTIGLIGGMSWESTAEYYRLINEEIKSRMGGFHSAKCLLYSVDFGEIENYMKTEQWDKIGRILINAAKNLENGGAGFILLCTNTMHKLFEQIQRELNIELLHIADATAEKILEMGIKKVGLLGTRQTMEQNFYKSRLEQEGIQVLIPNEKDRQIVHEVIFNELCLGKIKQESRKDYKTIIEDFISQGAEGIILGCTEIPLLIKKEDSKIPLFDTTYIHAMKAVERSIN